MDENENKDPLDTEPKENKEADTFRTPEEIAFEGDSKENTEDTFKPTVSNDPGKKFKFTRKTWIIIIIVVVLLIGGGVTTWALTKKTPVKKQPVKVVTTVKPKPVTNPSIVPSTLTGLPVAPSVNQRPVTAVMIENSTFARPQSGLDQAGVVFEAIAEGGITRFVALYQDTQPSYIGPVRSVRPYYLTWLMGFDAVVAHVGGSPEALQDISNWGVRDMNQFYNGGYFERITSRVAPHNVYTSISQLNTLEQSKGFTTSNYTGFPRKADQPSKSPDATTINFDISSADYNVQYQYDAANNDYKRFEGGQPHMEMNQQGQQTQITPKVVIAMVMSYGLESDGIHSVYGTIGSGPVYVFQDGTVTQGTWHKASNTSQITFTNNSGGTIKLDAGSTWLTALGSTSEVSY